MAPSTVKVLLVGSGAREHSLAWKLEQSTSVEHIYVVPGNGGTAGLSKTTNITTISRNDYPGLVALAKQLGVGLVVAGPDDVVVNGIEGYFSQTGIPCFAPSKAAAEIEGSKEFAKELMKKYSVPTAEYKAFSIYDEAKVYLESVDCRRIVIKADGLAAGKGVVLPENQTEAQDALKDIMLEQKFGSAGASVLIEEFLVGDEISILTFADGKTFKSLPPGQDHKRIFDGNKGPNTGGMGVYAPVSFVNADQLARIDQEIIKPTLDGLKVEGRPFVGMLFTGIMMTEKGPKVLEYNARFGDPETQTMMMLLAPKCDLANILLACCNGTLEDEIIHILPGFACNVVVAAGGYPEAFRKGDSITLREGPPGVEIFHAGTTKQEDGTLNTAGGRVLCAAAYGDTLEKAVSLAYEGVKSVGFADMTYRKDIASRNRLNCTAEPPCISSQFSRMCIYANASGRKGWAPMRVCLSNRDPAGLYQGPVCADKALAIASLQMGAIIRAHHLRTATLALSCQLRFSLYCAPNNRTYLTSHISVSQGMDPLQVAAAAVTLTSGIIAVTTVISKVSADIHDASDDISAIGKELQALQSLLGPVSKGLARFGQTSDPSFEALLAQVKNTLTGAHEVVGKIELTLKGFVGRNSLWAKLKWTMFGNEEVRKLRLSLESYKVALGIGLHVMSISIVGDLKDDTEIIREVAEVIRLLQTDDVLARLDTREKPSETRNKVEQWLEKMADYTSYAETAYQATMIDPTEDKETSFDIIPEIPDLPDETFASSPSVSSFPNKDESGDPELASIADTRSGITASGTHSPTHFQPLDSLHRSHKPPYSFSVASSSFISEAPTSARGTIFSEQVQPSSVLGGVSTSFTSVEGGSKSQLVASMSDHSVSGSTKIEGKGESRTIDWSPLVPEVLPEATFQEIVQAVRRDEEAINKSQEARNRLSTEHRKKLDVELLQAVAGVQAVRSPSSCEKLLARGAKLELAPGFVNGVLIQLVEQRDHRTLATFLKYGVEPDGSTRASDPRQPLAVAASCDVACFCALILAGAKLEGTEQSTVCARFCQSGTQARSIRIFCSPFLAAFAAMRPHGKNSIDKSQFWVSHFLLVNGADVRTKTCTSAMELVVRHWKIQTQYRITKHLLSFGADVSSREADLQFRFVMQAGNARLAQLLVDNAASIGGIARRGAPMQDPLVLAAEAGNSDCIAVLLGQAHVDQVHLFSLIHVYMSEASSPLTRSTVESVIKEYISKNPNVALGARENWRYYRMTDRGSKPDEEQDHVVSLLELAETVVNEGQRDREHLVGLLRPKQAITDPVAAAETKRPRKFRGFGFGRRQT